MNCSAIFAALIPLQKNQQLLTRFASVMQATFSRLRGSSSTQWTSEASAPCWQELLTTTMKRGAALPAIRRSRRLDLRVPCCNPSGMSCRVNYYRRRTGQDNEDIKSQMNDLIILEI